MKQALEKLLISLIGRKMLFAMICEIEKIIVLGMAITFQISWEFVAFFILKDIVILACLGMVQFEKIALSAKVGS